MGHPDPKKILESSKLVAIGVLESIFALGYLLAKQTGRAKRNLLARGHGLTSSLSTKRLLLFPSCRKLPARRKTAPAGRFDHDHFDDDESCYTGGTGEGELWQRSILMGDKCQPLDFSGVIYYDCDGNRVSNLPTTRSPRITDSPFAPPPLAGYLKY